MDKLALLADRARQGQGEPEVIDAAFLLTRRVRHDPLASARTLHGWVRDAIAFTPEQPERFQRARYTLRVGRADCDCKTILLCAMLGVIGVPCTIAGWSRWSREAGWTIRHVCPLAWDRDYCETTLDAAYGEHPAAAAARLSAHHRSDIVGR